MTARPLAPDTLRAVAERFKLLAEPARLGVLNELRQGARNVSDLVAATGLSQANLSKHLQLLHAHGFVNRRRDGAFVIYNLADRSVFQLCEIMCAQLERRADEQVTRLRRPRRAVHAAKLAG